jgi:hypothetical protein
VKDPEGRGVPGIVVSARSEARRSGYRWYGGTAQGRTDDDGRFALDVALVHNGWALVCFDAPGWVPPEPRIVDLDGIRVRGLPADLRALRLVKGEGLPHVEVVLERGAPISGVVETPDGSRLPDILVEAIWDDGQPEPRWSSTRTDDHGSFSLNVSRAAFLRIRAGPGDFLSSGLEPPLGEPARYAPMLAHSSGAQMGPVEPGTTGLRLVLEETRALDVRVFGSSGPLEGAVTVRVTDVAHPAFGPRGTWEYLREGESLRIDDLLPGVYDVEILPDAEHLPSSARVPVPGPPVDIHCAATRGCEGVLEGDNSRGFEITWTGGGWSVGAQQGQFVLRGPVDAIGDVYARRPGDPRCAFVPGIRLPAGVLSLTLSEGETIRGRVDAPPGLNLSKLCVRAARGVLDQRAPVRADGTFAIRGLPPGSFRVELVTNGYPHSWIHDAAANVPAGAEDVVLRVRLPATAPAAGGS